VTVERTPLPASLRRTAARAFAPEALPPRPALGWPLLPLPDAQGRLNWPELTDSVADSLRIVLATRPGEQLQHPGFGVGLENALQRPNTVALRADILRRVGEQVRRHEPRAVLDSLELLPVDGGRGLQLDVRYRVAGIAETRRLLVAVDRAEAEA
jgi:phage baseplate assembly protein W